MKATKTISESAAARDTNVKDISRVVKRKVNNRLCDLVLELNSNSSGPLF